MKRWLKRPVHAGAEWVWASAFAVAGHLRRSSVERWQSTGGGRVLVIAPHPDDEVIGCGGTLIRHRQAGDTVCIAYVTDGSASRAGGREAAATASVRRVEAAAAARALHSSDYEWLGFVEGGWDAPAVEARLAELIERYAPNVMYVPSRVDFHPEHHRVAAALARALAATSGGSDEMRIRIYQAHVPLTSCLSNLVTETGSVAAETRAAFAAHASQSASLVRGLRVRRYAGRYYRASAEVEEFWQLSRKAYCELHCAGVTAWITFASLHESPLTDPRAYLDRLGERRRLARRSATF